MVELATVAAVLVIAAALALASSAAAVAAVLSKASIAAAARRAVPASGAAQAGQAAVDRDQAVEDPEVAVAVVVVEEAEDAVGQVIGVGFRISVTRRDVNRRVIDGGFNVHAS